MIRKVNNINLRNFTDGNTYTVSNTTTQTITASISIDANTFKANDWIMLDAAFQEVSGTAAITSRFYWNTTATITGAIQIGSSSNSPLIGVPVPYFETSRRLSIRTANGGGSGISLGTEVIGLTGATNRQEYGANANPTNLAINWTVNSVLFCTVQMDNATSTARQQFFKVWTY